MSREATSSAARLRHALMLAQLVWLVLVAIACAGSSPPSTASPTPVAAPVVDVAAIVSTVDQQHVRDHIDAIDEPRNAFAQPAQLAATADYLDQQLRALGYTVRRDPVAFQNGDSSGYRDANSVNVTGVQHGTSCPDRIFVVGAHFDTPAMMFPRPEDRPDESGNLTSQLPGADDNASGVAGMLEFARVLKDTPLPVSVWFTGFTMEEEISIGSGKMAADAKANGTQIVGMFSLEMIGYTTDESQFIFVGGNEASVRLIDAVKRASALYVPGFPVVAATTPGNGEEAPDIRRSDHAPFWDAGYQAAIVTDTANVRNPNYHRPTDTLDTLDLPFATNVTKAMLASMVDYVTQDADGDGQPDVCTSPLATPPTAASPGP